MVRFILAMLLVAQIGICQTIPCATDILHQQAISRNPEIARYLEQMDRDAIRPRPGYDQFARSGSQTRIIPVVFYIVHDGTAQTNLSDAQIANQMEALNNSFSGSGIEFCLATKYNNNAPIPLAASTHIQSTPGIIHVENAALSNHLISAQQDLVATAHNNVDKNRYLRIWVVKSINAGSGILGYSMFPNTSSIFDGIVIRANVTGNGNAGLLANYDQGEVLVHEAAHYLGIYHTFENGCYTIGNCNLDGDRVCDTPAAAAPNFYCPQGLDSCPIDALADDTGNFMDYGNHLCADHFTQGQIDRMHSIISWQRPLLVETANTIFTGTCGYESLIAAQISTNSATVCEGASVQFNANIIQNATYSWNFGDPASGSDNTSALTNPTHVFASENGSPYTVTLTITRMFNGEEQIATTSREIVVSACTPVTGNDSYWYISTSHGLDFSSGLPILDASFPQDHYSQFGCNSQCDENGNLLFYTNNQKVWNGQHQQISNVDLILPNNGGPVSGSVLILPKPLAGSASTTEFYIFTNYYRTDISPPDLGFRYSTVTVNNGNAAMTNSKIPVALPAQYGFSTNAEGGVQGGCSVSAVQKCNGYDYWLLATLRKGASIYLVVLSLTSDGIAFVSERQLSNDLIPNTQAMIEMAPNGNKLLFYNPYNGAKLFDFNKAQGIVSENFTQFPSVQHFGATFSPNSKVIYLGDVFGRRIIQYNIDSADILATKRVINTSNMPWAFQTGPDGKIYTGMYYNVNKLAVIHNPDNLCDASNPNACAFTESGPQPEFFTQTGVGAGLPNRVDAKEQTAFFEANDSSVMSIYITGCNTYKFFPNICGTSFKWIFTNTTTGVSVESTQTNPVHAFTELGNYTVTLTDENNAVLGSNSSIAVSSVPDVVITGSDSACLAQPNVSATFNSAIAAAGSIYNWAITSGTGSIIGGSNLPSVQMNWTQLPGAITLTVTEPDGCTTTQIRNIAADCSVLGISDPRALDFSVIPNPSSGMFTVSGSYVGLVNLSVFDINGRLVTEHQNLQFTGAQSLDLSAVESGVYVLRISCEAFNYNVKLLRK